MKVDLLFRSVNFTKYKARETIKVVLTVEMMNRVCNMTGRQYGRNEDCEDEER